MNRAYRVPYLSLLSLGLVVLWAAGCHSNQQPANNSNQIQSGSAQNGQQYSTDPAAVNVAPVASGGTAAGESQAPPIESAEEQAYSDQASGQPPQDDTADEAEYGIQPEDSAPQPPPPLPQYDQPPCPGDGYIWTPGYWDYASSGYYWVPGAWVEAPYAGALWTPGYWAFAHGRYNYFQGYWGSYVGFYGGINYGYGYTGYGYRGGYWRGNTFQYNRTVNNINVTVVRNYYNYRITQNTTRVSYNGPGGAQARPRLAELAALREPHAPPMNTQLQVRQQAMANHASFAHVNHGRPDQPVFTRPVAAQAGVHPVRQSVRNLPAAARPAPETARHVGVANQPHPSQPQRNTGQVNRMGPPRTAEHQPEPVYPETNRAPQKYGQPMRSQAAPAAPTRPQSNSESPRRVIPQQQTNRPQTSRPQTSRPQTSRPPQRTEPGRAVTARPQAPEARPQPQRTEPERPKPQARPEEKRPAPDHP